MTLITKAVATVGSKLPKVIQPKGPAICDYVQVGTLTVMGAPICGKRTDARLWRHSAARW
jgi:hypothetical protein